MKIRKFFSLLMVAALCVGFTACNDDDGFDPSPIYGSWLFDSLAPAVESSDVATSIAVNLILAQQFASVNIPDFTLNFKDDGTCTFSVPGETPEEAIYVYNNGKLTITGDLSILQLGNVGNSATFDVTIYSNTLTLELDMKPLLGNVAELQAYMSKITKLAIAIKLNRVS